MKIYICFAILLLSGCSTTNVCDYGLSGWQSILNPPVNLITAKNENWHWFKNMKGDFFACPELVGSGVCGSYYEFYEKKPDGSYEYEEILCME